MPKVSDFPLATYATDHKVPLVGEEHLPVSLLLPPSVVAPSLVAANITDSDAVISTLFTIPYTGNWVVTFTGMVLNNNAILNPPSNIIFLGLQKNGAGASLCAKIYVPVIAFSGAICTITDVTLTAKAAFTAGDTVTVGGYKGDITGTVKLTFMEATGIMVQS